MRVVKLPTSKARMETFSKEVSSIFPVGEEFSLKDYVDEYNDKFGRTLTEKTFKFYSSVALRAGMLKNAVKIKKESPGGPDTFIVIDTGVADLPAPNYEVVDYTSRYDNKKEKKTNSEYEKVKTKKNHSSTSTIRKATFKKFMDLIKPLVPKNEYWLPKDIFESNRDNIPHTYDSFMYYVHSCKKRDAWKGLVRQRGSDGSYWYKWESGVSSSKEGNVYRLPKTDQLESEGSSDCFACDGKNSIGAHFCQWCGKPQESIHLVSVDTDTFEVVVPMGMPGLTDITQYFKEHIDIKVAPMEGAEEGYVIHVFMKED